jgi:mannose-6-phosphate isomerase-like protein (cupin superfamily)
MDIERGKKHGGFEFLEFTDRKVTQTDKGERIPFLDHPTAMCRNLEIHSTRLNEKGPSHPPHSHEDTEVILVLEGEVEVNLDGSVLPGKPNDLYLIKSGQTHGISNRLNSPCRYLAIRWR